MSKQILKPDFIVDEFGGVKDVRYLEYQQDSVNSSENNSATTSSKGDKNTIFKSRLTPNLSKLYFIIPVGLLVVIILSFTLGKSKTQVIEASKTTQNQDEKFITNAAYYFEEAESYFDKGEFTNAIDFYDKAIQKNPDYAFAYNNRGLAYHVLGDYDKALEDFNIALQLLPKSASVYNNIGLAYLYKEDYENSISAFQTAIQNQSYFGDAFYNRGIAYFNLGDYDKAILDFDKAIQYTNEDFDGQSDLNLLPGTENKTTLENDVKTIHFESGLEYAYTNRGCSYVYKDDYERAFLDFAKAIELRPEFSLAYYDRGGAYFLMGDYEMAIADYRKVLEFSNDPWLEQSAQIRLEELENK